MSMRRGPQGLIKEPDESVPKRTKPHKHVFKPVDIPRDELTFDERFQILRRLRFWADLFAREAETFASIAGKNIGELTKGLEEKRFLALNKDAADMYEQKLMNTRDAVELWRFAKGLDNHRFALLEETKKLFPEQNERLKYFNVTAI